MAHHMQYNISLLEVIMKNEELLFHYFQVSVHNFVLCMLTAATSNV